MIRLLTIIGARPQIIKAAALSREITNHFADEVEERIMHTGQHYDENMSAHFFEELGIPAPYYQLGVGSASHGIQTAKMIEGIEQVLKQESFDGVVLYGDTNSTLAGAIAASKLCIPIFHIEAGLRFYDMEMPEEVNRCVCDQLSSVLFAPTQTAMNNLAAEGYGQTPMRMYGNRPKQVILSGDVMYDNSMYFSHMAEERSTILSQCDVHSKGFILATIHRNNNTDQPQRLNTIFRALMDIAEDHQLPVVLPLHPRTRKLIPVNLDAALWERIQHSPLIRIIPPASFFDIIQLEKHAQVVITDSGGVQKESFFFSTPTIILFQDTPWVEIVEHKAGICADADYDRILSAYKQLAGTEVHFPPLFGDGHAAHTIMIHIIDYIENTFIRRYS